MPESLSEFTDDTEALNAFGRLSKSQQEATIGVLQAFAASRRLAQVVPLLPRALAAFLELDPFTLEAVDPLPVYSRQEAHGVIRLRPEGIVDCSCERADPICWHLLYFMIVNFHEFTAKGENPQA